ncbi:MAG: hypothetical protein M3Q57_06095, partial [Pseudomonadota bacterium]|nr:hypothetical protein [Pseudomonadota bacterium]
MALEERLQGNHFARRHACFEHRGQFPANRDFAFPRCVAGFVKGKGSDLSARKTAKGTELTRLHECEDRDRARLGGHGETEPVDRRLEEDDRVCARRHLSPRHAYRCRIALVTERPQGAIGFGLRFVGVGDDDRGRRVEIVEQPPERGRAAKRRHH